MNITEDIVKAIGFVKKETSSNPVYYFLKVNTEENLTGTVIIGKDVESNEMVWSLRFDAGDCAPFVKKLVTIKDLVYAISQHSFQLGERARMIKINKAIFDF